MSKITSSILIATFSILICMPSYVYAAGGATEVETQSPEIQNTPTPTTQTSSTDTLFSGDKPQCELSESGNTVNCKSNVLASSCELVSRALFYLERDKDIEPHKSIKHYSCSEFVDPIPARFFGSSTRNSNYCVTLGESANSYTFEQGYDDDQYCIAMLQPSGDINIIFGFVVFIYDLALPFLVTAAVLALVLTGVLMMYSGSSEEATKKSKEMILRIAAGLALLFSIKIILSTVDSTFFVVEPESNPLSTSIGGEAGATWGGAAANDAQGSAGTASTSTTTPSTGASSESFTPGPTSYNPDTEGTSN